MRQLALAFEHAPEFRAPFFEAPSNAAARRWLAAEWPQRRLLLWGAAGSGKTHLLHGWADRAGAALLAGAALGDAEPLGPIAVDDCDQAPERPLLHLLNGSAELGHPVLLATRTPPGRWPAGLPDLTSRLRATAAVELHPLEDELMRPLLARLLADRQLAVAEPVQEWLLARLPRTPAALREAAARLDHASLSIGGRVTRTLAADTLDAMQSLP